MKKNKKIVLSMFSVFALTLNLFLPAVTLAYNVGVPAPPNFSTFNLDIDVNEILQEVTTNGLSSVTSQLEDRYGIDEDIWRKAQRKVSAPRMEIFFDNTNPKPGEKVTAHAVPEFFKNDPQNLYYTWYIIHTKDGRPQTAIGDDPIKTGKIEAAKLIARGDYDPDLDEQDYTDASDDRDRDGWPSVDSNSSDEDVSTAPFGGADGTGQHCYRHLFGTNTDVGSTDDSSGEDSSISCDHKWKSAPGYTSGSGKFPNGEEEYWKTDPTDPDTDGDGFKDEADVLGLGQESFTWNFQEGDRVGVVVEGTSMIPVDENNAYFKIMWGYPDICDNTKAGLLSNDECGESDDYGYGFLATKSPSEQGDERMKLSLSFSPDNPLADPSNENKDNISASGSILDADQITVSSSLDNTDNNPNNLYYSWQIQKGDPQGDKWGDPLNISENFDTTSPAAGMGISEFSFTPKKKSLSESKINYFKVTLNAGTASNLTAPTGKGRSSVIIPVNTQGIKISLHKVDIANGKAVVGDEVCTEGLYKSLCPVVRGQMLAAEVSGSHYKSSESQFSWQVNNAPVYPPANASQLFDGWDNTTIFLPITKNEQELESISVTATSKEELQPATGARLATVVHPAVFIKSGDTSLSWPKTYVAEDPNQKSTYQTFASPNAFEALTNSNASYYLDFVPYYLLGEDTASQINWSVNGTDVTSTDFYENNPYLGLISFENNDRTIQLPTSSAEGAFTNLSAEVKKYWSEDERDIPYSAWGVVPDTLSGDSSVSIEAVNAPSEDIVGSANNPGQILAAIGTHLPHYFMYLLRLVLTMTVMFVVSAGFYGLSQRLSFSDDEK